MHKTFLSLIIITLPFSNSNLLNYKINKVFGHQNIAYLSQEYLDSPFIYECARGKIDPNKPPKYN